ncbi:MAG: heme ABC exporter ATP-binding protein CcmA [Actinobacteria bacterium]|nr:heme ABC exporter ATP-binding protein CcmA [Actinomycetota bacterium]
MGRFQGGIPLQPLVAHLRSAVTVLGRYPALAGVDLDVAEGEVVLLTGPNGAGKTTLLRLLAGLAPLTGGHAEVLGHDLRQDRRAVRRHVAVLGHETFCYEDLTVRENLRFHARAAGGSVESADAAIERVGLIRSADTPHRLLSAGQRRRLALGVVATRPARLLLLDEPHAGLDAAGRVVLDDLIGAAGAEGVTVVMASHELERARPLATREVAMAGGYAASGVLDHEPRPARSRTTGALV